MKLIRRLPSESQDPRTTLLGLMMTHKFSSASNKFEQLIVRPYDNNIVRMLYASEGLNITCACMRLVECLL